MAKYVNVNEAARIMHDHRVHHAAVTEEQKVVSVLSAFDLRKPVE